MMPVWTTTRLSMQLLLKQTIDGYLRSRMGHGDITHKRGDFRRCKCESEIGFLTVINQSQLPIASPHRMGCSAHVRHPSARVGQGHDAWLWHVCGCVHTDEREGGPR